MWLSEKKKRVGLVGSMDNGLADSKWLLQNLPPSAWGLEDSTEQEPHSGMLWSLNIIFGCPMAQRDKKDGGAV